MTDKEMLERTKLDLENFNSRVEMLRQYKLELNEFRKQDQPPQKEIDLLELKIRRIELNIKILKISLSILTDRELEILTDYYFDNILIKDIAIKLNLSKDSVSIIKKKAFEQLANCMYGHMKESSFALSYRDIPEECVKKKRAIKPVYQYDIENNLIKKWDSVVECSKNGFTYESVRLCCLGKYKQHKGYKWSYEFLKVN